MQQILTRGRVRVEVHPGARRNCKRTRVIHVASDGTETDISAVCKRAVITLDVNAIPIVELTCHAEFAVVGEQPLEVSAPSSETPHQP